MDPKSQTHLQFVYPVYHILALLRGLCSQKPFRNDRQCILRPVEAREQRNLLSTCAASLIV